MDALGLGLEFRLQFGLGFEALAGIWFGAGVNVMQRRAEVGQHESIRVLGAKISAAFFSEIGLVAFFINGKKEFLFLGVELDFLLVGVKLQLGRVHNPNALGALEELGQAFGGRLAEFDAIEQKAGLF